MLRGCVIIAFGITPPPLDLDKTIMSERRCARTALIKNVFNGEEAALKIHDDEDRKAHAHTRTLAGYVFSLLSNSYSFAFESPLRQFSSVER